MARGIGILAATTIPLFLAACDQSFTVRPGDVERIGAGFRGQFEIAVANPGEQSVSSFLGTGGACLVTQDPRWPKLCQKEADCEVSEYRDVDGNPHVPQKSAHGYCLPYHNPALPKTCWIKPSQAHCRIPVNPGKHFTPVITEGDARAYLGAGSQLSWRVVACVNGNDDKTADVGDDIEKPPCAEPEKNLKPGERLELPGRENPEVSHVPALPPPLHPPSG